MLHIAAICAVIGPLLCTLCAAGWLADKVPARWVIRFEGTKKQPARVKDGQAVTKKNIHHDYSTMGGYVK